MNDDFTSNSVFRIGKVTSVDGRTINVSVDKAKNSSHLLYKGELIRNVSVGSFVKILKGFTKIVCKVEGEYTNEDLQFYKRAFSNDKEKVNRSLRLSLLGFFSGNRFERGIKELPLVDNECYLLTNTEFVQIHSFTNEEENSTLEIGTLALESEQSVKLSINSLFASHIGIFGNTGSGKSYTLAKIYYELFKSFKDKAGFSQHSKFYLLDFNGEYLKEDAETIVDTSYQSRFKLSSELTGGDKLPLPANTLHDSDFWRIVLQATEKTQGPFLKRALRKTIYVDARISDIETIRLKVKDIILSAIKKNNKELGNKCLEEILTELNYSLRESTALDVFHKIRPKLDFHGLNQVFFYKGDGKDKYHDDLWAALSVDLDSFTFQDPTELEKLRAQIVIKYYEEIVQGHANQEHLSPLLKRMDTRFKEIDRLIHWTQSMPELKNFVIISLKNVSVEMKKILPLLLCRYLYDTQKNNEASGSYLNIIIDEAHNILSSDSFRESEQWKDYRLETFEEIIKEGRKFGVFLTLASQRPSDISSTIISQLHNYFLHRLINNNDIHAIEKTVSYLDKVSFESLPILPTGTCILAGQCAHIPVLIQVGPIPTQFEPNNKTRRLTDFWSK